ncbi:MAG: Nif3-like dinuclear metal center hexameric protein [Oscillospiraceae bacterium]|nr:Nif3-like dinuclear metal center hexameric protein [Oscillospiraceae bacterium]
MTITINDIERAMFEWAPASLAMRDDRNGLAAGDRRGRVSHVLAALDVTLNTIAEAKALGADVIVAHHPIVWGDKAPWPSSDTDAGSILLALCGVGVAAVTMHTNLDAARGGINDVLARLIGLEDVRIFDEKDGIGRMGRLPKPMSAKDYAVQCKAAVGTGVVRYYDAGRPIEAVALCSGGGAAVFPDAIKAGCDAFVTGDVKHSDFLIAQNQGVTLFSCGHFATENIITPVVADYLRAQFPGLKVTLSRETAEPFVCL